MLTWISNRDLRVTGSTTTQVIPQFWLYVGYFGPEFNHNRVPYFAEVVRTEKGSADQRFLAQLATLGSHLMRSGSVARLFDPESQSQSQTWNFHQFDPDVSLSIGQDPDLHQSHVRDFGHTIMGDCDPEQVKLGTGCWIHLCSHSREVFKYCDSNLKNYKKKLSKLLRSKNMMYSMMI